MQNRIYKIISVLFVFLISLLIVCAALLTTARVSLFRGDFYHVQMQKAGYAEGVLSNINETLVSLGIPGGIPKSVMENVVTAAGVSAELNGQLDSEFKGTDYEIKSDAVHERFMSAFLQYAKQQNIEVDKITESNLAYLADECTNAYVSNVTFPFISQISSAAKYYNKYFVPALAAILAATAALCVVVWILQKWKHRAVRFYTYAVLGSGVASGGFALFMLLLKPYNNLRIDPQITKSLITSAVSEFFVLLAFIGLFLMLAAAILIPVYKKEYRKSCKR